MVTSPDSFRIVLNVFSEEECRRIVAQGLSKELHVAYSPGMMIDPDRRSSMIRFMYPMEEKQWIWDRLWTLVRDQHLDANINTLSFVQFTEYKAEYGGHFEWHRDTEVFYHPTDTINLKRKLTCVIQLSDPNLYEGGDLEFVSQEGEIDTVQRCRGCAILFPSRMLHRANKVKSGTRYSLVAWFEGPK